MKQKLLRKISPLALIISTVFISGMSSAAEDYDACKGEFTFTKTGATYEDFDFWLGEWQVFDTDTGQLRGYDVIEMVHDGCTLHQEWRQMDDSFSPKTSPTRLRGSSLTGIAANGKWRQLWTDNSGSNLLLTGGLDEGGVMALTSDWIYFKNQEGEDVQVRNILYWKPLEDGSVHNWGEQQRDSADGPKTKFYDIIYRNNSKGGLTFSKKEK